MNATRGAVVTVVVLVVVMLIMAVYGWYIGAWEPPPNGG